ncbi:CHAT domain-containing protein [Streptomyces sp. NPDC093094]|uniref:CHAT domain-containing protein n=1 Tax=Streptomyces sp. NPDC093094 TaxID=3366026 RepID=UPI0038153AB6
MTNSVKVMVVDDHPLWRDALARELTTSGFTVVTTASHHEQAVRHIQTAEPDVVVIGLSLFATSGAQLCRELLDARPSLRILVVSAGEVRADVLAKARAAGVTTFLLRSMPTREELTEAVHRTALADLVPLPEPPTAATSAPALPRLTARETEVLKLVASGLTDEQAANSLGLSIRTVRRYIAQVMEKYQIRSRQPELVRQAVEHRHRARNVLGTMSDTRFGHDDSSAAPLDSHSPIPPDSPGGTGSGTGPSGTSESHVPAPPDNRRTVPTAPLVEPHTLTAELAEQAPPGREVPLQVQVTRGSSGTGAALRDFHVPAGGARLTIAVHAPGLLALGDLQQEVTVLPGRDSDVVRFGLRTLAQGLHTVTVRAFRGGSFLGELRAQISVQADTPARDGPPHSTPLTTLAFDPGEVTLQVLKGPGGAHSFQLLSETTYAPESFHLMAGNPHGARELMYDELRRTAAAARPGAVTTDTEARRRLRNLGVQLWASAVPDAVRRQFWEEAGRITSLTVLGEHDAVPWELLYPRDRDQEGDGFLAEWLPVVRRVFGQDRVRELRLHRVAFVVPPDSPPEAEREVTALRTRLGNTPADHGTLSYRRTVSDLIEEGSAGLLHFACHNSFTSAGSRVTMADGPFDPLDLAYAAQSGALRKSHPLVFFNACRSVGEINWFASSLGWATQFLRAGAGAFVGTLWPVRSDSAFTFADTFYDRLVAQGQTLGQASLQARQAIRDQGGDPTWLAYAVYGSPAARAAIS